jgi:transposase-like protein
MKRSRKPYSAECKQETVRLLKEQQLPRSQVAHDLGIDAETLYRWARERSPVTPSTHGSRSIDVLILVKGVLVLSPPGTPPLRARADAWLSGSGGQLPRMP